MAMPNIPANNKNLRLICFDGGGVRGLASLFILSQILSSVGNPLPCQYFDMIGGTSTGALIAIMLGCLEMDVQTCINKYIEIMRYIFQNARHTPIDLRGNIVAKYDKNRLRDRVLGVIRESSVVQDNNPEDLRMRRHDRAAACRVFVVATYQNTSDSAIFSNYPRPLESQSEWKDQVTLCEAALASTAALSFFDPMLISHGGISHLFLDGAFVANNPVHVLWNEAQTQFTNGSSHLSDRIRIMLSIGTGKADPKAISTKAGRILEVLKKFALQTGNTAKTFHETNMALALEYAYMRFDPPYMEGIGLDDASKRDLISALTAAYGNDPDQIQKLHHFQRVAGTEQNKRFYVLNRSPLYVKNMKTESPSYWSYMTLAALEVYENIYRDIVRMYPKGNGYVSWRAFQHQFYPTNPPPRLIEEIWRRLLRDRSAPLSETMPKGFVIAILYMLHIESIYGYRKPKGRDPRDSSKIVLSASRRELCKSFGFWAQCQCGNECGRRWNFANNDGLSRGGDAKRGCAVTNAVAMIGGRGPGLERYRGSKAWMSTRQVWERGTV